MWGRKDQDQFGGSAGASEPEPRQAGAEQRSNAAATSPAQPRPAAYGMDKPQVSASSQIGKTVRFKGDIYCEEDLFVNGLIEGTIKIPKNMLVIGAKSQVNATVQVRSLVIHGSLKGKVHADERIEIKKTGSFEGNLVTDRLVIEDGGIFRGTSETNPRKPPASPPKPAAPTPAPVQKAPAPRAPAPSKPSVPQATTG